MLSVWRSRGNEFYGILFEAVRKDTANTAFIQAMVSLACKHITRSAFCVHIDTGLIQLVNNKRLWKDVAFRDDSQNSEDSEE